MKGPQGASGNALGLEGDREPLPHLEGHCLPDAERTASAPVCCRECNVSDCGKTWLVTVDDRVWMKLPPELSVASVLCLESNRWICPMRFSARPRRRFGSLPPATSEDRSQGLPNPASQAQQNRALKSARCVVSETLGSQNGDDDPVRRPSAAYGRHGRGLRSAVRWVE